MSPWCRIVPIICANWLFDFPMFVDLETSTNKPFVSLFNFWVLTAYFKTWVRNTKTSSSLFLISEAVKQTCSLINFNVLPKILILNRLLGSTDLGRKFLRWKQRRFFPLWIMNPRFFWVSVSVGVTHILIIF